MTTVNDIAAFGLDRTTDDEIRNCLSSQVGVLGLPPDGAPSPVSLPFGHDGDSRPSFTAVVGSGSRKRALAGRADTARFLVDTAPSAIVRKSVLLRGTVAAVTDELERPGKAIDTAWRPDLFRTALESADVEVDRFQVEERSGVNHTGVAPHSDAPEGGSR